MEITLSPEQEALLDASATERKQSKESLVTEALTAFLEHDAWFREGVEKARESARLGRVVEHDEVVQRLDRQFRE